MLQKFFSILRWKVSTAQSYLLLLMKASYWQTFSPRRINSCPAQCSSKPVFPVKVLYNLAKLYTFPSVSIPEHVLEETEFSPAEKSNMNLNAYL